MIQRLVLASSNRGKLDELCALLDGCGLELHAQSQFGVDDVSETGATFIENALLKARHAARATGLPALGDDSGLCVDALDGAPGLYSARYAGADGDAARNIGKLLAALGDLPDAQRTARFHCVLALLRHPDDPRPLIAEGSWRGRILTAPRGTGGFGYDPVFFDPERGCSAAELDPAVKQRISHRGRALALLRERLARRCSHSSPPAAVAVSPPPWCGATARIAISLAQGRACCVGGVCRCVDRDPRIRRRGGDHRQTCFSRRQPSLPARSIDRYCRPRSRWRSHRAWRSDGDHPGTAEHGRRTIPRRRREQPEFGIHFEDRLLQRLGRTRQRAGWPRKAARGSAWKMSTGLCRLPQQSFDGRTRHEMRGHVTKHICITLTLEPQRVRALAARESRTRKKLGHEENCQAQLAAADCSTKSAPRTPATVDQPQLWRSATTLAFACATAADLAAQLMNGEPPPPTPSRRDDPHAGKQASDPLHGVRPAAAIGGDDASSRRGSFESCSMRRAWSGLHAGRFPARGLGEDAIAGRSTRSQHSGWRDRSRTGVPNARGRRFGNDVIALFLPD